MKKVILISSLIMSMGIFCNTASAQQSFGNAGLEIALPVGDWAEDLYGIGIGGSGGYEFGISDNFAVNANVGITFLSINSDVSDFIKSSYYIPVQVGARYYITESREGLFGELALGLHTLGVSTEDVDFGGGITIEGSSETETYFSLAPTIGYFLNENISLSLRYQLVFQSETTETVDVPGVGSQEVTVDGQNLGYIGLKAAYNF